MKKILTLAMLLVASVMSSFAYEKTLWSGSQEFLTDWGQYINLSASDLSSAKEGDVLMIHVTALTAGGVVYLQHNWADFDPVMSHSFAEGEEAGYVTFTLTAAEAAAMQTDGLNIKGTSYTCDEVVLANEEAVPTTEEIDLTKAMESSWDASYDPSTKTITWTGAWGGCGWWYSDKDCSAYTKITYEFAAAAPAAGGIDFQYVTGDAGWVGFSAGDTKVELDLDATRSSQVKAMYLKLGEAGSIQLSKVYFTKSGTTAINKVNANVNSNNGKAYDLAGKQAGANTKGLLIINGKKVLR